MEKEAETTPNFVGRLSFMVTYFLKFSTSFISSFEEAIKTLLNFRERSREAKPLLLHRFQKTV